MSHSIPLHSLAVRSELADTATVLGAPARAAPLPGEPRIGDRLGPYYLQELVGEGGMGRVFRAVHEKLGRQVAIKLLRRSSSFGNGVSRFLREARVVNRVRHPGLIEITDIVEALPGGDSYYVMEWLEGRNLHQRMLEHGGRLPPGEYLSVLIEVATVLESVHAAGLVHRDLKPENIYLVAHPGEPEKVKVIDFGVALDRKDPDSLQEDDIVGTPAYVSPEQARGEAVDGRTDIYSMGVVLYEQAVGRLPFEAKTALDALAKRLEGGPPRPRKAAPRGADVPRLLEQVILRAMETTPARRYPTMTAFREDLQRLRQHLLLPRWQRGLAGMATIAVPVALVGAGAGLLWSERDAILARTRGVVQTVSQRVSRPVPSPSPAEPVEAAEPLLLEVTVATTPAGAEVRSHGKVLGVTPCVVRLPEGPQELELRRGGYKRERRRIDVRVGAELSVRLSR